MICNELKSYVSIFEREVSTCPTSCPLDDPPASSNAGTFYESALCVGQDVECGLWSLTDDALTDVKPSGLLWPLLCSEVFQHTTQPTYSLCFT